jgi:regulator of protease activity HflC (stomatin/prohibitin superfamily)
MNNKSDELKKTRKRKEFKKMIWLWIWVMLAYAIFARVALVLIEKEISIDKENQWNLGWAILAMEFLHFSLSFRVIGPTSLGAVLFFGRPLYQVKSGLVYVPFIVCQLAKEDRTVITIQFPAEPEKVDKSGDNEKPVPPGFVKPIRVTTGSRDMISSDFRDRIIKNNPKFLAHPLNEMMTLEPSVVVRFQIRNDDFISFLTNIGSRKKAISAMRDTVDSVLNIEFPKRTPALIIMDKEVINKQLKTMIEILVGEIEDPNDPDSFNPEESWGLNIINAQLPDVDLTKKINKSLRDIVDSKLKKTASITEAEGKKKVHELEGEGENKFETEKGKGLASARLDFLKAEADGLEKIAKVAETEEGKLAVVTKATEQGLKGSQYSIVPDGAGSIIAGIMETLKKTKSRDEFYKKNTDADSKPKTGGKK